MLDINEFIIKSIDLNLFFLRIMKEHALFLQLGFTPRDSALAAQAASFGNDYNDLLAQAVSLGNGVVSTGALTSCGIVTQYTLSAEQLTQYYTGLPLDTALTLCEASLSPYSGALPAGIADQIQLLNHKAYRLTDSFAGFKRRILEDVRTCRKFTSNYPLFDAHLLRESEFYMTMLAVMMKGQDITGPEDLANQMTFWNNIMAEHAQFIAGLLDPAEKTLIHMARIYGMEFEELAAQAAAAMKKAADIAKVTAGSIQKTVKLRDFKESAVSGILNCSIQSIIIPLMADHVLREANHYLCVLGVCNHTAS